MSIVPVPIDETQRTIDLPPGPALLYVTEGDNPTITILDRAPIGNLPAGRDRVVCLALLGYVIEQLHAPRLHIENCEPGSPEDLAARKRFGLRTPTRERE
ncbi:hypothetical protein FXF51_06065 [Nonomuraea sp. PA05]|uniref:hypothetical protein n=1 Tax=Nonomuraea sp. PA05 TaxID=2604466 RepID=UPI0011D7FB6D|nr:hypothetical protein [Nonomuraea sp. PA05]TYB69725.1 hypothetical protein FXF51_06065 [Nonomuraea sp. PA05]